MKEARTSRKPNAAKIPKTIYLTPNMVRRLSRLADKHARSVTSQAEILIERSVAAEEDAWRRMGDPALLAGGRAAAMAGK